MLPWFCILTMPIKRLVKIYFLLLDFLKACQNVLIRKIRFLTFSFITTTLLDVLDKNRYQDNAYQDNTYQISSLHILALTTEVDDPERCLRYDTYANSESSQGNPLSKLFWLKIFWVGDIHSPTHHKKSAKTNKNQSILTKKLNLKFQMKSYLGLLWFQRDDATHQGVSVISQG